MGSTQETRQLVLFDIRAINVSPLDRATVVFVVNSPDGFAPTVSALDPDTKQLVSVQGSQLVPSSMTIAPIAGTHLYQIRFVLDATSTPELTELSGTIFPVSIPLSSAPQPPPLTATPTVLASAGAVPGSTSDADDGLSTSFARTGFASGSGRALAVAPSQNSLTGTFGYGGPNPPRDSDLGLVGDVLAAAHAAYWARGDDEGQPAARQPAGGHPAAAAPEMPVLPQTPADPDEEWDEQAADPDALTQLFADEACPVSDEERDAPGALVLAVALAGCGRWGREERRPRKRPRWRRPEPCCAVT